MNGSVFQFGKQLLSNFQNLEREILSWDSRDIHSNIPNQSDASEALAELNQTGDLHDSRMSMPTQGSRHSIVNVKNPMLVRELSQSGKGDDIVCLEIDKVDNSTCKPVSSSCQISDPVKVEKVPVKRVSFSNTHSVINDSGEEVLPVRHRDSITSASTDSSEDSTSSGEGRIGSMSHRNSKLRAKLPVTTGTTKQISEMVQTSLDGSTGSMDSSVEEWKPQVLSQSQKDMAERRKSAPAGDVYTDRKPEGHVKDQRSMSQTMSYDPMSPSTIQYSPFQYKGTKGIMSPPPQKGSKTHSRGSSISSVDSADSGQGHMISSPTTEIPNPEQPPSSWIHYDEGHGNFPLTKGPGQPLIKQGPPTAQKPVSIKKSRPQSSPVSGPFEMGHKRNTSKSSLESVEELQESPRGAIPVSSPIPPRSVAPTSAPPQLMRSVSQPNTPPVACPTPSYPPQYQPQSTMEPSAGPASSQAAPSSPAHNAPARCLSPRLSGHRVSGPKPVAPPVIPCMPPTPPALVPPTPRNPTTSVKTHKKRPSGGNIVVNGNDVESLQQSGVYADIVASPRPLTLEGQGQSHSANNNEANYGALPFMSELNQHMQKSLPGHIYDTIPPVNSDTSKCPPQTLPKPADQRVNGIASQRDNTQYHSYEFATDVPNESARLSSSSSSAAVPTGPSPSKQQQQQQQQKRQLPPPPPKRSESTKLSSSLNMSQLHNVPVDSYVPNQQDNIDPIYDNCDGILDISDLPPPPPELLEDFHGEGEGQDLCSEEQRSGKVKPPPPPPKRNRETQLSMS